MLVFTLMTGCATTNTGGGGTGNNIPPGCENSLVYKNVPNADLMAGVVTIAGLEAYKYFVKNKGDSKPVIVALENAKAALENPELTYTQFAAVMVQTNEYTAKYAGLEVMFLATLIDSMYQNETQMDNCDRNFFNRHLANTIMMIKMIQ
jgi:hypothetical protein